MIKVFLGGAFVLICALIGARLSENKKFIADFFEKLKTFNSEFAIDVGLYSTDVSEMLSRLADETDGVLSGYEVIFSGDEYLCRDKRLSNDQRKYISYYVNSLGRYDGAGQKEFFKTNAEKIESLLVSCRATEKKYSALSLKLSVCIGFTAFIFMI